MDPIRFVVCTDSHISSACAIVSLDGADRACCGGSCETARNQTSFAVWILPYPLYSALCAIQTLKELHWVQFSHASLCFFIFVILFYQNACYGCKHAENRTWSEFFYDGQKFWRQCVNEIDTRWVWIYFLTCKNFRRKFRTQCAMT